MCLNTHFLPWYVFSAQTVCKFLGAITPWWPDWWLCYLAIMYIFDNYFTFRAVLFPPSLPCHSFCTVSRTRITGNVMRFAGAAPPGRDWAPFRNSNDCFPLFSFF